MCQKKKLFLLSLLTILITLTVTGWIGQVQCQDKYPTRAIEIIVPLVPGGSSDLTARLTASYLSKKFGVPVNVVNKSGGNTIPGNLEVYNARPDGYTLHGDSLSGYPQEQRHIPFPWR